MKADRRKDRHRDEQTQIQPSTKTDSQTQRHTQRHTQRQAQRQTEEARQLHVIALFVYFVSCLLSFPSCYSFLSYFFAGVDPIPDPLFPCRASKQPPSSLPSLDDPIPFALDPIVSLPLGPLRKRKYLTDVVAVREGELGWRMGGPKQERPETRSAGHKLSIHIGHCHLVLLYVSLRPVFAAHLLSDSFFAVY